jgi:hypothetical protein
MQEILQLTMQNASSALPDAPAEGPSIGGEVMSRSTLANILLTLATSFLGCGCAESPRDSGTTPDSDSTSDSGADSARDSTPDTSDDSDSTVDTDSAGDTDSASGTDSAGDTDSTGDSDSGVEVVVPVDFSLADADAKFIGEEAGDASSFGIAVHAAGDLIGDGQQDEMIGMPGNSRGGKYTGTTYVFSGPVTGVVDLSEADAMIIGEVMADLAGASLALIGDSDGDGWSEVAIGAPGQDAWGQGAAYVVQGPMTGVVSLTEARAKLSGVVSPDPDPDCEAWTGATVAAAGDVDGDGLADLLVGANGWTDASMSGMAFLVSGPISGNVDLTETATATFEAESGVLLLGYMLVSAGDINGDSFDDVIVGSPYDGAYLYYGPISGSVSTASADAHYFDDDISNCTGCLVAAPGDMDGDGEDDLAIGMPGYGHDLDDDQQGAVFILNAASSGEIEVMTEGIMLEGAVADVAGCGLSAPGDIDGDGFADLMIGAPHPGYYLEPTGEGTTYVVLGPVLGPMSLDDANYKLHGDDMDMSGSSTAGLGDIDSDGLPDILVGGPGDADGGRGAGAVWLVLGATLLGSGR